MCQYNVHQREGEALLRENRGAECGDKGSVELSPRAGAFFDRHASGDDVRVYSLDVSECQLNAEGE